MQYFEPDGQFFVGDCMPFFHDGVFHLYYLLDEGHHTARGGLGCHQWAHASSRDLIHWEHHPLALPLTSDWEGSICTGSVFYHEGIFYAFYANRAPDYTQTLCVATSTDGVHFEKSPANPFAAPAEGYSPMHYRDPCVFRDSDTGLFHLLVTAELTPYDLQNRGGCLAHLVSPDLQAWELTDPFIIPGYVDVPECPDYFFWHGWYYLIFSNDGVARYRMSRRPFGPWLRPKQDTLGNPQSRVLKTAAFTGDRRLGATFVPSLGDDQDTGAWLYAGKVAFREITQNADGTLASRFPRELTPTGGHALALPATPLTAGVHETPERVTLEATQGFSVAAYDGVPVDARILARVSARGAGVSFGLCLRGAGAYANGYELRLTPGEERVEIRPAQAHTIADNAHHTLWGVEGLHGPVSLEVVLQEDIIDVCVDERHCLLGRLPELRGTRLFLFCQAGEAVFEEVTVQPLS